MMLVAMLSKAWVCGTLTCWDCGFESRWGHGYLSLVSVACSQVEVSVTAITCPEESY